MRVKRFYDDGTTDTVNVSGVGAAKKVPEKKKKKGVKMTAIQIIDVVTGAILALISLFKAAKK